jgi:hypothetical protein
MAEMERADPRDVTPRIPAHIVFLDGHNASPMDGGWLSLFWSINYAKRFTARTCFKQAYFAPYGYVATINAFLAHWNLALALFAGTILL